jgi:diguanylate cyclase (GGDEF)-like protein
VHPARFELAVLPKDESQQNAELRQAFLRHLPRRIEAVRRRGHRVCRGIWDVNTVTLLYQDVQGLAGAAGRYGLLDASERLFQVERLIEPLIRQLRMPSDEDRAAIEAQLNSLDVIADPPAPTVKSARDFVVPLPERSGHGPTAVLLTPPEEYWRRFSHREQAMLTSESHGQPPPVTALARRWSADDAPADVGAESVAEAAQLVNAGSVFALDAAHVQAQADREQAREELVVPPQPRAALVADGGASLAPPESRPRTGRIFYLSDIAPFSRELTQALGQLGYAVDRLESPEELKEMLGSLAPDLIVIDGSFFDQIEHLGEFIKRVRQRVPGKLPLLAFSELNDLNSRLKAMRAGVDTLIPLPISAADASLRVRELVEVDNHEPFRVMIVEDDRSQAMFAETVLRKAGMDTLAVTDPLDTLERLEAFHPDLVLMDLYMPNISGMELTAIIRERDQFINMPIVFLSGEQDAEKHFEALSAGGDDFLAKPIRPKFLISAVNNRARRARQLARRRALDPKDSTTGLYHRTFVIDRLNELLGHDDSGQHQGGVMFIEVEGVQKLREHKGLAAYEPVMRQVGATIASFARPDELAARYGDSTYLLLSPVRDIGELERLARNMVDRLSNELVEADQHSVPVAARIGIAAFTPQIADAADMLNAAERACSRSRQRGDAQVMVYQPESLVVGGGLVDAIRRALDEDGFQLLFQPIVSLHSTGDEQYEVLLRLRGDSGEIIGASQIIDVARGAGLVSAIDRWCLGKCLRVVEERKRQGRPVRLFVNQSVESTLDPERVPWLKQSLETRRVAPDALALELKLGDVLARMREALAFFEAVRKIGVRVVVDDYDGGLTALQLLSVMSTDYLKISDKYTRGNAISAHSDELRTLVRAAHDGGRYVIAPKVETAQSAASLWTMGVDLIQGNFVQQPGSDLGFDFSASAL